MFKIILMLLVLVLSLSAVAADKKVDDADTDAKDPVSSGPKQPTSRTITRSADNKYIYITEPERLTFDPDQTEALEKANHLLTAQIANITKQYNPQMDPNGDLKALVEATNAFSGQLDQLIQLAGNLYGNASANYDSWTPYLGAKMIPTGVMPFFAAEYDKNLVSIPYLSAAAQGGGSVTIGVVFVPQKVTRIAVPQPGDTSPRPTITYTQVSTGLVVIPTINGGVGVTAIGGGQDLRGGLGLIFGELDSAADVVGLTGGTSATFDAPALGKIFPAIFKADGINLKVLAIKNSAKPGAVTNMMVMLGVEQGVVASPKNGKILSVNLESHLNLSYIWDFTSFFSSLSKNAASLVKKVSGSGDDN